MSFPALKACDIRILRLPWKGNFSRTPNIVGVWFDSQHLTDAKLVLWLTAKYPINGQELDIEARTNATERALRQRRRKVPELNYNVLHDVRCMMRDPDII